MSRAPEPWTHADFTRMLLAELPGLREEVEDADGLLHLEMAGLAGHAGRAKERAEWETYRRCLRLAHTLWERADPALRNAVAVSFVEHLDFAGPHGATAWSFLPAGLRTVWKELQEVLDDAARRFPASGR